MAIDESKRREFRRMAYGKLLVGSTVVIESAVNTMEGRYEFDRPGVAKSKTLDDRELRIQKQIASKIKQEARKLRILGWHLQGIAKPRGYTP